MMDYRIKHNKADLESTGYMEIGPGKYAGLHWQDGFAFIWEDAFGVAEGIIERHFPSYDHLGMNDVPNEAAAKMISEWRSAAQRLPSLTREGISTELNLSTPVLIGLIDEVDSHRHEVARFLQNLANECEEFLKRNDGLCILGM